MERVVVPFELSIKRGMPFSGSDQEKSSKQQVSFELLEMKLVDAQHQ